MKVLLLIVISVLVTIAFSSTSFKKLENDTSSCNCFTKAVTLCGTGASARGCRKQEVRSCFKKCTRESNFASFCNSSSRSCNCAARAINKCGMENDENSLDCRNKSMEKCRKRCGALKPACKSCECFIRSVRKCGSRGDAESRNCRNAFVKNCAETCKSSKYFRVCDGTNKKTVYEESTIKRVEPPMQEDKISERTVQKDIEEKNAIEDREFVKVRKIFESKDYSKKLEFSENKRICITESQCACRTVARRKCTFSKAKDCYETELQSCEQRCQQSRRCFRLDCRNAGVRRCKNLVERVCTRKQNEEGLSFEDCVTKRTQCCRRKEASLCLHARRWFKYRNQCDISAGFKCGALSGAGKCQCESSIRAKCIEEKFEKRIKIIERYFDCKSAANLICEQKSCSEYKKCVEMEQKRLCGESICERESRESCTSKTIGPCYDENLKKCTERLNKEYCLNNAIYKCDFEQSCVIIETKKCDNEVPPCFKDRSFCEDNNKCTIDVCDVEGCKHIQKDCNDNNPCTSDFCDPQLGCINQKVECKAGPLCYKGECNPEDGKCSYKFEKTLFDCDTKVPCQKTLECIEWGNQLNLKATCQRPVCDESLGVCVAKDSTEECATPCIKTCVPEHGCQEARCIRGVSGEMICDRKDKVCGQSERACFVGRCDREKGCVYEYVANKVECPEGRGCKVQEECDQLAKKLKLTCQTAKCNAKGVCEFETIRNGCVTEDQCKLGCVAVDKCEKAECIVSQGKFVCQRNPVPGCIPQNQCELNCVGKDKCENAKCVFSKGNYVCQKNPIQGCVTEDQCKLNCVAVDQCETSQCVFSGNNYVCQKTHLPGCMPNSQCKLNCVAKDKCEKAECIFSQGNYVCQRNPVPGCDTDVEKCKLNCIASNKCESAQCKKDDNNNYFCDKSQILDCDTKERKCLLTCTPSNNCEETKCVSKEGQFVCERKPIGTCNKDEIECKTICKKENSCQQAVCVKVNGKFECQRDNIPDCDIKFEECREKCKPLQDCQYAKCIQVSEKEFSCLRAPIEECPEKKKECDLNCVATEKCENSKCVQEGEGYVCARDRTLCKKTTECPIDCVPNNKCESATCVQKGENFECKREPLKCPTYQKCQTATCDNQKGCVYKFVKNAECIEECKAQKDCDEYAKKIKVQDCLEVVCNKKTGSCEFSSKPSCSTTKDVCKLGCKAPDSCHTSECVQSKNGFECKVTKIAECNTDEDICRLSCVSASSCESSKCVKSNDGKFFCERKPIAGCNEKKKECELKCKSQGECVEASCVEKEGNFVCEERVVKNTCETSKKCVETCIPSHDCERAYCVKDGEKFSCKREIISQCPTRKNVCELKCIAESDCETATCEKKGDDFVCKKTIIDKKCKTDEDKCKLECKASSNCFESRCIKNQNGQFACEQVAKVGCDVKSKVCEETCKPTKECEESVCVKEGENFVCKRSTNKKCIPSKKKCELSCVASNSCEEAKCVQDGKENFICKYSTVRECQECKLSCKPNNLCEEATCVAKNGEYLCERVPLAGCTPPPRGNLCVETCVPSHECEDATCVKVDNGNFVCKKSIKSYIEKCREVFCPVDCVKFESENKKNDCQVAECVSKYRQCKFLDIKTKKCKEMEKCKLDCKARTRCETSECEWNEQTQTAKCTYKDIKCDDNKECTKDSCNIVTGCVHVFTKSDKCKDECKIQDDCAKLSIKNGLKELCKDSICDEKLGTCVTIDVPNCIPQKVCELECGKGNLCEVMECVADKNAKKGFRCVSQKKNCDDNKACTKDRCDLKTGLCVHDKTECKPIYCEQTLDCVKWGIENKLEDKCEIPICDEKQGVCIKQPKKSCTKKICEENCKPRNACEEAICGYDDKGIATCVYKDKTCDDKSDCTKDTCDKVRGCIHEYIPSEKCIPCEKKVDCVEWGKKQALQDKCQEAVCEEKSCKAVMINNDKCYPPWKEVCVKDCSPKDPCETTNCHIDAITKKVSCIRKSTKCDDGIECTLDICDPVKGCQHKKNPIDKCKHICQVDSDCIALTATLVKDCKEAYCDKQLGACVTRDTQNKDCEKCKLACKPENKCEEAKCIKQGADFICQKEKTTPEKCNDGKECTLDRCDPKHGCVNEFVKSSKCLLPCLVDKECSSFPVKDCEMAYCDQKTGSCATKFNPSEKCKSVCVPIQCPPSEFGSVCCLENGVQKCSEHKCIKHSDCEKFNKNPSEMVGYCVHSQNGCGNTCEFKGKCKTNFDCNDKNPCTKDACIKDFGVCLHTKRCVDRSECTFDICIPGPGKDSDSFECRNPLKSCTDIPELLNKNLAELSESQKAQWLGKCSHLTGCESCVVHAQCDDNNGCTRDVCREDLAASEKLKKKVAFCFHEPIHNEWCDPKLKDQPITFQSVADLRNKGILLGYDLSRLQRVN